MSLASLYNIPRDKIGLDRFSFANQDQHNQIAERLAKFGVTVPSFLLDPIPLNTALGVWLYNHQAMHNAQNAALNILGNDLTDVDFRRLDQIAAWINIHASEHYQAAQLLGT